MSQREAYQTDPMGRLALVTAYEALEMPGFVPNRTPSSMLNRIEKIDMYYIPGTIRAFATGRINYHFKFTGPSYNIDTACSSSFAAQCTSLLAKECDTSLAGELNVMTSPDLFAGLSCAHFLSKTGSCKTFDDGADGFCRSDGVGTVVLKRVEDAEADNDPVLAVVLGTATNHSSEAVSITRPHRPAQEFVYRKILNQTGVDPVDVSYVEMHGTGTQAGDGSEMKSTTNVFAPRDQGHRQPDQLIHLGALKSNIGHGEASAGMASLIKTVIMMQKSAIPAHVGIKTTMNKTFPHDLNERGVRIAFKETPWLRPNGGKRRAYLNNFGASGGNTGLLLEDRPALVPTGGRDPRTSFNIDRLATYLESNPDTSLPALSYTTTARRIHYPHRVSYAVRSISGTLKSLRARLALHSSRKTIFEASQRFRNDVMEFKRIGQKQGFLTFLPLIDGSEKAGSLSPVALQLGQSCVQIALARLWQSWGITQTSVLGHSLREYAALNVAGVLSVSDTIYLVGRRAQLLEELCTPGSHKTLTIAASVSTLKETLGYKGIEVASNGDLKTLKAINIKCTLLSTAYAFHSAQIQAIIEHYRKAASSVNFGTPNVPYGDTAIWRAKWSRLAYLVRSRINSMNDGVKSRQYQKIDRKGAYECFSGFVEYEKQYHGMKEVVMDQKNLETTSKLEFQPSNDYGEFEIDSRFIDNISHLSGFILNGSGATDTKEQVFVSHGWDHLQIAQPLSSSKSYSNYVKMREVQKATMSGDVYVFDGEEMVALVGSGKFRAIPRAVIDQLLSPLKGVASSSSRMAAIKDKLVKGSKPLKSKNAIIDDFLVLIGEELGVEPSELQDDTTFADLGLDSLMSLSITGHLPEELDLEAIPSSLFTDFPTIGPVKAVIMQLTDTSSDETTTGTTEEEDPATADADDTEMIKEIPLESAPSNSSFSEAMDGLLAIVCEEVGIDLAELLEVQHFAEAGVDSLMSLTITGRVREDLDMDISCSFFVNYPTVDQAKLAIASLMGSEDPTGNTTPYSVNDDAKSSTTSSAPSSVTSASTPVLDSIAKPDYDLEAQDISQSTRPATSIVLQGSLKTASKTLFLLPDGSGSATSYAALPRISPDLCVFGLNCLFMKTSSEYTTGIEGVASLYLSEIRRRQPEGPYVLRMACWRCIEALFLIDSPCPINLQPLPSELLYFVDSLGLLGVQGSAPNRLIPHFEASIKNLANFMPYPMDSEEAPRTHIIWARDGFVSKSDEKLFPRSNAEAKSVKFLLDGRQSLGTYGWEKLIGSENISVDFVEGNHFTMIREPKVNQLSTILDRIIGS
ncbi:unnamed protein product [Penicillium nalgiovense]|nr:unnamed protein product [Penicillium nalgiovense]